MALARDQVRSSEDGSLGMHPGTQLEWSSAAPRKLAIAGPMSGPGATKHSSVRIHGSDRSAGSTASGPGARKASKMSRSKERLRELVVEDERGASHGGALRPMADDAPIDKPSSKSSASPKGAHPPSSRRAMSSSRTPLSPLLSPLRPQGAMKGASGGQVSSYMLDKATGRAVASTAARTGSAQSGSSPSVAASKSGAGTSVVGRLRSPSGLRSPTGMRSPIRGGGGRSSGMRL